MNKLINNKMAFIAMFALIIFITGTQAFAQRPAKKRTAAKTQSVRVEIVAGGYSPEEFRLKKGVPARVTFVRKTEDECGKEVIFPAYNIRRELPLNRPVTVAFTPRKTGSFSFACGMGMMEGKAIVQ